MSAVRITDAGDTLLITAPTKAAVETALHEFRAQGAKVVSDAAPLGNRWVASCTKPELSEASRDPGAAGVDAIARRAALRAVTISDAGPQLIVSGDDRESVQGALDELARTGAQATSAIAQVGKKWIAHCENLGFGYREVKVEQNGLSYTISGRSLEAVKTKLREFESRGAKVTVEIQKIEDEWVVTCDTGGGHDVVFKW